MPSINEDVLQSYPEKFAKVISNSFKQALNISERKSAEWIGQELDRVSKEHKLTFGQKVTEPLTNEKLESVLTSAGVEVVHSDIPIAKFEKWYAEQNYEERFPTYSTQYTGYLKNKALEHFMSLELIELEENDTIIDIAGCTSPFTDVVNGMYDNKIKAYYQDLPTFYQKHSTEQKKGIFDNQIFCSADDIPMPDGSVEYMVSHNSWEHFEGDADVGFLRECARLLKKKAVIIPLFFNTDYFVLSSVGRWQVAGRVPDFDPGVEVVLNQELNNHFGRHYSPEVFVSRCVEPMKDKLNMTVHLFDNANEIGGKVSKALVVEPK